MLDEHQTGPLRGFRAGPRRLQRPDDDPAHRSEGRFRLTPLSPTIGAVVDGVSLADDLDDEGFADLNRALLDWKVLFFRNQDITHAQHAAFARRWGALERHPFAPDNGEPEVVLLAKDDKVSGYENAWHSDVTWRLEPSLGSVLRAVEVPSVGGDTLWADMGAAYDNLTADLKATLDGLVATHDWEATFGRRMSEEQREHFRELYPIAEHPVVRTHPETGRKTLYVNRAFTTEIVGLDPDKGAEILEFLYLQATFPEYQCRWRWEPGDVAFWDNRSTQHYATSDYHPERRVMERITIVGDRPR